MREAAVRKPHDKYYSVHCRPGDMFILMHKHNITTLGYFVLLNGIANCSTETQEAHRKRTLLNGNAQSSTETQTAQRK